MPLRERIRQRGGVSTSPRAKRRAAPTSAATTPTGWAIDVLPTRSASRSSAPALICCTLSSAPTMITAGPEVAGGRPAAVRASRPARIPTDITGDRAASNATSASSKPSSVPSRKSVAPPHTDPRSRKTTRASAV